MASSLPNPNERPAVPARLRAALARSTGSLTPDAAITVKPTYDPHRRMVLLVAIPLAIATMVFAVLLLYHHVFGGANAFQPVTPTVAQANESSLLESGHSPSNPQDSSGVITVTAPYVSEIVEGNSQDQPLGIVSTPFSWNDYWFYQDPTVYNHGLATACVALCAIVNSESAYYGEKTDIDFVAKTLGQLGFTNIKTDSYQLRSKASDEVVDLFTGGTDVVAFVLARKELPGGETLVFVGVRGTYGSEWLSNFNFLGEAGWDEESDHAGFSIAESEIEQLLEAYCDEYGIGPGDKILVTGHSRGGAVANLLAADLDTRAQASYGPFDLDDIYAYTFAAPQVSTRTSHVHDAIYNNIFNVVNPSDLVPRLPLSGWGYQRYGITVELPGAEDSDFAPLYAAMQDQRALTTGYRNEGNPITAADAGALDELEERILEAAPAMSQLGTFEGVVRILGAFGRLNIGHAVASHYPDTYLAWMQVLDPARLVFSPQDPQDPATPAA